MNVSVNIGYGLRIANMAPHARTLRVNVMLAMTQMSLWPSE